MVRKFQILKRELGWSLQFWMKPSPGVWDGTCWVMVVTWLDFLAWVAPRPVKKGLRWQHWSPSVGMEGLLRDIRSAPFPCFMGEETESQRVEEIMGSPSAG